MHNILRNLFCFLCARILIFGNNEMYDVNQLRRKNNNVIYFAIVPHTIIVRTVVHKMK